MLADIEFEQRRKRRRILHEPSISPVTVDDSHDSDVGFMLSTYSSPLRDMSATSGKETQFKAAFLSQLGLQPCDRYLKQSKLATD